MKIKHTHTYIYIVSNGIKLWKSITFRVKSSLFRLIIFEEILGQSMGGWTCVFLMPQNKILEFKINQYWKN